MPVTLILRVLMITAFNEAVAQLPATEKEAVGQTIRQLFTGMEKGDSALVSTAFTPEVTMVTIFRNRKQELVLQRESSLQEFLVAVGTPHEAVWYEEFWNLQIQIDGDFAQAWCEYAFYAGKNFSHCGVDAFQLIKMDGKWQIFHLADTRRKEGCAIPRKIRKKYE